MSTVRVGPLDAACIFTEFRATPNQVGGLLQFRRPEAAPKGCMRGLMTDFRCRLRLPAQPWNVDECLSSFAST
jgi:hypothetical protein